MKGFPWSWLPKQQRGTILAWMKRSIKRSFWKPHTFRYNIIRGVPPRWIKFGFTKFISMPVMAQTQFRYAVVAAGRHDVLKADLLRIQRKLSSSRALRNLFDITLRSPYQESVLDTFFVKGGTTGRPVGPAPKQMSILSDLEADWCAACSTALSWKVQGSDISRSVFEQMWFSADSIIFSLTSHAICWLACFPTVSTALSTSNSWYLGDIFGSDVYQVITLGTSLRVWLCD